MRKIDLSNLRSYTSVLEEAKRASDLPQWVHVAILAEYAKAVFNIDRERFVRDVPLSISPTTLGVHINAVEVWKQVKLSTRLKIRHAVYYVDAGRSEKYRNGTWSATQAVEHQKGRRRARSFRHYVSNLSSMARVIEDSRPIPIPDTLTPEVATELLDSIKVIAKFLERIARKAA